MNVTFKSDVSQTLYVQPCQSHIYYKFQKAAKCASGSGWSEENVGNSETEIVYKLGRLKLWGDKKDKKKRHRQRKDRSLRGVDLKFSPRLPIGSRAEILAYTGKIEKTLPFTFYIEKVLSFGVNLVSTCPFILERKPR